MKTILVAAVAVFATSLVTGATAAEAPTIDERVAALELRLTQLEWTVSTQSILIDNAFQSIEEATDRVSSVEKTAAAAARVTACITTVDSVRTIWTTINGRRVPVMYDSPETYRTTRGVYWFTAFHPSCIPKKHQPANPR